MQDFNELMTVLMKEFDLGERLLFTGLVSKAFDTVSLRCHDPSLTTELACAARYKLFEFLRSYKELRGVGGDTDVRPSPKRQDVAFLGDAG